MPVSLGVVPLVVSLRVMPLRDVSDDIPPVERMPVSDGTPVVSLIDPVSDPLVAPVFRLLRLPLHPANNMATRQADACEVHFIAYTSGVSCHRCSTPHRRERTAWGRAW